MAGKSEFVTLTLPLMLSLGSSVIPEHFGLFGINPQLICRERVLFQQLKIFSAWAALCSLDSPKSLLEL